MLFGSIILFLEYIFNWGISNTFRVLLSLQLSLWKGKCFQRFKDGTNESRQVTKLVETAEYWRVWNSWWCVCGLKLSWLSFCISLFSESTTWEKCVCVFVCVCVCERERERERERENCSNGYWRQWESWIRERRQRWWKERKRWQIKGNRESLWCGWNFIPRWLFMTSLCPESVSPDRGGSGQNTLGRVTAGAARDKTSYSPSRLTHAGPYWLRYP